MIRKRARILHPKRAALYFARAIKFDVIIYKIHQSTQFLFCRSKEEKQKFRAATNNQYDSCSNRTTVSVIQQTVNNSYCVTVICLLSLCSRLSSKRKLESIHGWSNLMRGKNYLFSRNDFKIMASIKSLIASHKKAKYNGWKSITRRIEAGRKMTEMQENIKKIFT